MALSGQPATPTPTADQFDAALRRHVLDTWFPRCLDRDRGGFLCDFDRAWNAIGPHHKLLEFQARQTLVAAELARVFPADERLHAAAVHGFACLRDVMWDRDAGGWFHLLDRSGKPLEHHTKHIHGMAYALQACAAVHTLTGDAAALQLARDGFEWMERYAYDRDHGGYHEFFTRSNQVILSRDDCPWPTDTDTIGTPLGFKDANVFSDLIEAFTDLRVVWPDARVRNRLAELLDLLLKRLVDPDGALHFFYHPDWTPTPYLTRFGTEFQTSWRLAEAVKVVGDAGRILDLAGRMVRHAERFGHDRRGGGYYFAGPAVEPMVIAGQDARVRAKEWWVQLEALKGLLCQHQRDPADGAYARAFARQWDFIQRGLLDERYGGTFGLARDDAAGWRRWYRPRRSAAQSVKAHAWKDASHDGRVLAFCAATLRRSPLSAH